MTTLRFLIGWCANIASLFKDRRGNSAVEYAVLIAGLAAFIVVSVGLLGGALGGVYQDFNDCLDNPSTCLLPDEAGAGGADGGAGSGDDDGDDDEDDEDDD